MAMVRASGSILLDGSAELGHRDDDDIAHAIAEIAVERRKSVAEFTQPVAQLATDTALVRMSIPSTEIGEGHFQADIGFDDLRDLQQRLREGLVGINRAVLRLKA